MESELISLKQVNEVLTEVLQLGERGSEFELSSPLLGAVPEFDSMAVVAVITALEDNYGITVDDDEITAEVFETVGNIVEFVNSKVLG
ncbi:MAG: acyl carrier protein [Cellvibrionaceae bacterium]|nr:acyl carrier protein [Cellvibrionaceae bacterium]|tara:strand:- start:25686 stop:25949 length:264 start_codon:yes stop_codon:yes gene_type:complete